MRPSPVNLGVLLLSAPGGDLLVPVAAIAEVVRGQELGPRRAGYPDWVLGTLAWRGQSVPVARLSKPSVADSRLHTVVVCLAPSGAPTLRYLAIASPDLPRLERLSTGSLAPGQDESQEVPWYVLTGLTIDRGPAWLLNLAALERELLGLCA
ncbi:MAG: chemotaxis protein CheW [Chromatiaceae bacterium]